MNFDKNLVAKNFSRGAKTYDEAAQVQLVCARKLVGLISPYLKKDSQILDLGSGTSFIAKEILTNCHPELVEGSQELFTRPFDKLRVTEVDITPEMLAAWSDRPKNVKAVCADFENLDFAPNSFDLILSSFSLQWSSDFVKNFAQYFSLLKPNGIFAFAVPTEGSLVELSDFNLNELPKNSLLKTALKKSGFNEKLFREESIKQDFASSRDLLRFLKESALIRRRKEGCL